METIIKLSGLTEYILMCDPQKIGHKLRHLRIQADLSVDDVSAILTKRGLNASRNTVYSWEQGARRIGADAFLLLCDLYRVNDVLLEFGFKQTRNTYVDTEYIKLVKKADQLNTDGCKIASAYIDGLLGNEEYQQRLSKKSEGSA